LETLAERDSLGAWGVVAMMHALSLAADYVAAGAMLAVALKLGLQLVGDARKGRFGLNYARARSRAQNGSQGRYGPIPISSLPAKPTPAIGEASSAYCAHTADICGVECLPKSEVSNG
jgi:hypothetical protein